MSVIIVQSRDYSELIVLTSPHALKVWMEKHNLKYGYDDDLAIDKDKTDEDDYDYFIYQMDVYNAKDVITYDL